ncbi:MAG: hypothetical protein ABIG11_10330 [bacterium]
MTMPNPTKPVSLESITLSQLIRLKLIQEGYAYLGALGLRKFLDAELAAYQHDGGRPPEKKFRIPNAKYPQNSEGQMRNGIYTQRAIYIGSRKIHIFYEEAPTKGGKDKTRLGGSIDLLGVDKKGRIFIIELKHSRDTATSVLETLFQVLIYRAYFANRKFRALLTPVLQHRINQCEPEERDRREALIKAQSNKRSFAAIAVLQTGMHQLKTEKTYYTKLLTRYSHEAVVGVVSIDQNMAHKWGGAWLAGCPKSW